MGPIVKRRQGGQAIALAAVAAVALVGALALVVDAGFFYEARRELQSTADQAVMAGVAFLPQCPSNTGGSCGSPNNAQDMTVQMLTNNGPIARELCGDPNPSNVYAAADFSTAINSGATPGTDIRSSIYTPDPVGSPGVYYYRLDVTVRCSPGFSFGRILLGDANQPLSASASAIVGSLQSSACSAPLDVVQTGDGVGQPMYAPDPGTAANNFGYPAGVGSMSYTAGNGSTSTVIQAPTGTTWTANQFQGEPIAFTSGADSGLSSTITSNTSTTITVSPAFTSAPARGDGFTIFAPPFGNIQNPDGFHWYLQNGLSAYPANSGDITEICLPGGSCQQNFVPWLAGQICIQLSTDQVQQLTTLPGIRDQRFVNGLIARGYDSTGPCPNGASCANCPQALADVIYTPGDASFAQYPWQVKPGGGSSLCLWTIAVLPNTTNGGSTSAPILTFITIFVQDAVVHGNNSWFDGVVVTRVGSGETGGYRQSATHSIRLIR